MKDIEEKSPVSLQCIRQDTLERERFGSVGRKANRYAERRIAYRLDTAREEGEKKGKAEGKIEVAKAMLANNVDVDTIIKFTVLSISEIKELSKNQ